MSARQVTISFPTEPTWFEKLLGKEKGQEVVAAGNKTAVALPNTDEVLYRFDSAVTSTDIFTKATRRIDTAAADSQPAEPTAGAARPLPKPSGLFDDDDDDEPQPRRDIRAPADDDSGSGFLATAMTDEQKRQQRDYSSLLLFDKDGPQPAVRKQRGLFDDDSDNDDDIFSAKRPAAEQASSEADALFHQAERLEERLQRAQQQQQQRRNVVTSVGSASALATPLTDASLDDDLFADTAPIARASKPAGVDVAAQLNSMDDITAYLQAQTLPNR